jgi:hypothetical protein
MRERSLAGYGLAVRTLLLVAIGALLSVLLVRPASGAPAAHERAVAAAESERLALRRARCPRGVEGCRTALGRVVYVESVDPDGDGDLHVVLFGRDGITAPGLTAVDVRRGLRPRRDPRVGQLVTAAGPVQRGSYGQRQIHALRFRVG